MKFVPTLAYHEGMNVTKTCSSRFPLSTPKLERRAAICLLVSAEMLTSSWIQPTTGPEIITSHGLREIGLLICGRVREDTFKKYLR